MAIERVKEYFSKYGIADRVRTFDVSSATVELAAQALACKPCRIAKTLSFMVNGHAVLIVAAGDAKIDNPKYKAQFGTKAKMLAPDEVETLVGHAVGGVCPFGVNEGVTVYLDESLKRFSTVFPACGSGNSAIELTIDELEKYSGFVSWVDVCKNWQAGLPISSHRQLSIQGYDAPYTVDVNGVTLHYAVAGEGKPIVLLHGNGEDHNVFHVEMDQLVSAGYKVYAPDSRGHGVNEPLTEYHYADMAEDTWEFIRALGLEKPALYGYSDGGIIGLLLEINHPGTVGIMAVSGTNLSPEGLIPSFIEEYTAINEENPNPLVTMMLTEPDIDPEELKDIRIPVLVTAGEYDLVLRSETEKIAAALPDARMIILKNEDHGSYIVGSKIMGNLLIDFLRERQF